MDATELQRIHAEHDKVESQMKALMEDGLTREQAVRVIGKRYDKILRERYLFEQSMGNSLT